MDRIDILAETSVARGCAFAGLAIFTLMVALSWDPALATQVGGLLTLLASLILLAKAQAARSQRHDRTELWTMLDRSERPPSAIAQSIIGRALQRWYLYFAHHAAVTAAGLLAVSLVFRIAFGQANGMWAE